jgi:hypothetical protein
MIRRRCVGCSPVGGVGGSVGFSEASRACSSRFHKSLGHVLVGEWYIGLLVTRQQ